jgi:multidrug resistance efflux pump
MRNELIEDLADCTEFRLTLQVQPPRIVHGTMLSLIMLLAMVMAWLAATQADLVVRAPGRARPVTSPMKVVNAGNGETLSASAGGRVVEVNVREGQEVRRGDILPRLDTERLDNEIAKRQRAIQAAEEELAELGRLEQLPAHQFASTGAKAEAELAARDYAVRRQEMHTKQGLKRAGIEALRLELANLRLEREQAVIRAPMDGIVTIGDLKVGDVLERGKPVIDIAEQRGFHFEAMVPGEEAGHLQVGLPARIKLDAYDYQRYGTVAGTVVFMSPDSGMPAGQGTATYLVKIELAGNEVGRGEFRGHVKLG